MKRNREPGELAIDLVASNKRHHVAPGCCRDCKTTEYEDEDDEEDHGRARIKVCLDTAEADKYRQTA